MSGANGGLVFVTIHDPAGPERPNPRSVLVIEELKEQGWAAMAVRSLAEGESTVHDGVSVVALYDVEFGVNRWSPHPKNMANGMPDWVKALSTDSCVAVGRRCTAYPSHVEGAARQIATMFSRDFHKSGHQYAWGNGPSLHKRKRRSRRNRETHHRRYLHR